MKSTYTPKSPINGNSLDYPVYRRFYDCNVSHNLFNNAIVLFLDADTMFIVHTEGRGCSFYKNNMLIKKSSNLFIPATDKMFHEVKGSLTLDFD